MGVVTVSSSAARSPLGLSSRFSTHTSLSKTPVILAFKTDRSKNTALVAPLEISLPVETKKADEKRFITVEKGSEYMPDVTIDQASLIATELNYNEAAAKLEHIYKHSPATDISDKEVRDQITKRRRPSRGKRTEDAVSVKVFENKTVDTVVRSKMTRTKRLNLENRIALRTKREHEQIVSSHRRKQLKNDEREKIDRLVRGYSSSTDLVSLDWKKLKIPPVLHSNEHAWLFKLMQPMKAILQFKEDMQNNLQRELHHHHHHHHQSTFPLVAGSAVRILVLHIKRFSHMPSVKPRLTQSSFTTCPQVFRGLPLLLLPPFTCQSRILRIGAVIGLLFT